MEGATRQSDQEETRRHRAGVSHKLVLGGIALAITALVLLWWL